MFSQRTSRATSARASAGGLKSQPTTGNLINLSRWITPSTQSFLHSFSDLSDCTIAAFLRHWSTPGNGLVPNGAASPFSSGAVSRNNSAISTTSSLMQDASRIASASFIRAQQLIVSHGNLALAAMYIINGGFLKQLLRTSFEDMRHMLDVQFQGKESLELFRLLPNYSYAFCAASGGAKAMQQLLDGAVPPSRTVLTRTVRNDEASNPSVGGGGQVDWISESWSTTKSKSNRHRNNNRNEAKQQNGEGESSSNDALPDIELVFKDGETGKEVTIQVPRDSPLKQFLQKYAEDRSLSLLKMQFAVKDEETGSCKSIFASDMGRKTTDELGWKGERVVIVVTVKQSPETKQTPETEQVSKVSGASRRRARKTNKTKNKKKNSQSSHTPQQSKNEESEEQRFEKYRLQHSSQLSEVFNEASQQFQKIRTTINAVNLERTSPKARKSKKASKNNASVMPLFDPSASCGGKAGISRYVVRIGEAAHLYKTSKPSVIRRGGSDGSNSSSSSRRRPSIDLHGLTRKEAVAALDERLPGWVEGANMGGYPWVNTVEIIAGGGNQILSEAVRQWIRGNDRVARAPVTGCV